MKELEGIALAKGAYRAQIFPARDVVLDPRVRLKCQVPLCSAYGRNLMCPPNTLNLAEFRIILDSYQWALLLQIKTPANTGFSGAREIHQLINSLEKAAILKNYVYAAGLIAGECKLCSECVGQGSKEACRHPFQARPSMEGMGIDVLATASKAGLDFSIDQSPILIWNGLILLD